MAGLDAMKGLSERGRRGHPPSANENSSPQTHS
jgi:hypothetical protein